MSRISSVRVIVAHQDPLLAIGVAAAFQAADGFEIVKQDGDSAPPPHWTQALYPAAVLVADYDTGLRHARHASVCGTILIVTHFHDEARIRRALQHGIRGYLLQGCSTEALIQGVLALHRGATAFAPVVSVRIAESLTHQSLTERELTVLRHLMLGLSNKELSRKLGIAVGTVKTHLKAIFGKLGASARTEAVAIAQRRGLLFLESSAPDPDRTVRLRRQRTLDATTSCSDSVPPGIRT
jgi:DNA-binding NarL/FixJ family response regulator